jgi:hypothetical protein
MISRRSPHPSDFNHACTSGEDFVPTTVTTGYTRFITYRFGVWEHGGTYEATDSNGMYCYHATQKVDNDQTDKTAGCYCSYQ